MRHAMNYPLNFEVKLKRTAVLQNPDYFVFMFSRRNDPHVQSYSCNRTFSRCTTCLLTSCRDSFLLSFTSFEDCSRHQRLFDYRTGNWKYSENVFPKISKTKPTEVILFRTSYKVMEWCDLGALPLCFKLNKLYFKIKKKWHHQSASHQWDMFAA